MLEKTFKYLKVIDSYGLTVLPYISCSVCT